MLMILKRIYQRDGLTGWLIFFTALLPRVLPSSGVYLNVDAAGHWITRSKSFLLGLTTGQVSLLAQSMHPGVPLMWLTSISELFLQHIPAYRWFTDPMVGYLTILKLPVITATAVLAALAWWIGRQVLPRGLAATIAVLLALDPLYLVYSRYLQLDALLTGLVSIGIIAWWGALQTKERRWARLAGVFFGLAALTRFNAGIAFGFAFLTWWLMTDRKHWRLWRDMCIAGLIAPAIVWPVIFRHPLVALQVFSEGVQLGFVSHELIVTDFVSAWVRPLYFPIFLLTRISTLELGLLVVGMVALVKNRMSAAARPVWYFLAWTAFVLASLVIGRKQIDRYALPALLGLLAIMACGWKTVVWPLVQRYRLGKFVAAGLIVWQLIAIGRLQPFFQTYRNLLGEGLVHTPVQASSALWPDWGEGIREAVNELHHRTGRWPTTASWYPAIICIYGRDFDPAGFPFAPRASIRCERDRMFFSPRARVAEYILISRDQRHQRYYPTDEIEKLGWDPAFVITLNRHPYVWVYRNQGNLPPME